ncbi:MAG: hypothetical protein WD069_13090 [Planctomycetales bacterium]
MSIVAYKLGGSLLLLPDLAVRIRKLLAVRPESRPLLIVGGGAVADVVREWDRVHELGEEKAHRLALRSLDLCEALLLELLPEARLAPDRFAAQTAWQQGMLPVVHSRAVLEEEPEAWELPHSWRATSDSIAAWIAACWRIDELVLVKSIGLPEGATIDQASRAGLVDPWFPQLAWRVRKLAWADLRADPPAIRTWRG